MKSYFNKGDKVIFKLKMNSASEFEECTDLNEDQIEELDGMTGIIDCLEFNNKGPDDPIDKDLEYYDVTFENGVEIYGCSGYNLEKA